MLKLLSKDAKSGAGLALALLLLTLSPVTLVSSPADGAPSIASAMNPVLLTQAGSSDVDFVLLSTTCGRHTCFRLERTSDGGQVFSLVKAPPIAGPLPTGNLYGLNFANPSDGYALTSGSGSPTALFATFDGGRSWHREVIRSDQRVEWIESTPTAFYAVTGTCPDPKSSCGGWGLYRTPASASAWTGRSLPLSTRGMEPPQVAAYGSTVWLTGQQQSAPYHALLATSHDSGRTFSVAVRPSLSSVNGCELDPTSQMVVWAQCDQGNMHGDIPLSRDGGSNWITKGSNLTGSFAWGVFDPVSRGFAYFVNGLYPSRLNRITVQDQRTQAIGRPPYPQLDSMVFTSAALGLALSAPIGPSGAQVLYRTTDGGAAWQRLAASGSTPARKQPLQFCSQSRGLHATTRTGGAGGPEITFTLVYVNAGASACKLAGAPGLQPLSGANHTAVGPSAHLPARLHQSAVVLAARGGAASSEYTIKSQYLWPASKCVPAPSDAVGVHLEGVPAFVLRIPRAFVGTITAVCTALRSTIGGGIAAGQFGRAHS